jgi:hypothetical protein
MNNLLILFIIIICLIIGYVIFQKYNLLEQFVPYKKKPYDEWDTGSTPLNYYTLPIYTPPYRYPFKYYTSYPYPYMRNYPTHLSN